MSTQSGAALDAGGKEPIAGAVTDAGLLPEALTRGRPADRAIVLAMFMAMAAASLLSLALFYVVTAYLAEQYIAITSALIHKDAATNKALLHLAAQSSILGGLGGSLFVMQQVTNYIGRGRLGALQNQGIDNYFLYAFVTPLKGLVAGIVGGCIIGGSIMFAGGIEALAKAHLFVIGCGCVAGYSEFFLQQVVDVADRKIEKL